MITWGFAFALIKPIVNVAGPIMALMFTRIVAGVTLVAWIKVSKTKFSLPQRAFIVLLIIAGLLDALGFAAYNVGVSTQYVSIISPIAAAYPLVTILLAQFILREHITRNQKIGIAAILSGLVAITII
jgi:drug/metabolite transporter (DMT)-like permease